MICSDVVKNHIQFKTDQKFIVTLLSEREKSQINDPVTIYFGERHKMICDSTGPNVKYIQEFQNKDSNQSVLE